ncbi:MAG: hypothetical protein HPY58_13545 [Firmicutes bacterium]|nr:hypothetical protein [Bacillota bacterium]
MMYGIGISFPAELTKKDIKKLKRELARDMFGVVDGGKAKSKPASNSDPGRDKTEPTGKKD